MERRSKRRVIDIEVYTDGSCKYVGQNMSFGGWAYIVVQDGKKIYEASGSEYGTTNQRMELRAILEGLRYAQSIRRSSEKVAIYSDSAYAINCYKQDWYSRWLTNGWTTARGESVDNKDLWENIIPFFDDFWYTFIKVNGHSNVFWNNKCDEMAQQASDRLKLTWKVKRDD